MVQVTVSGSITDNVSGIDPTSAAFVVSDEYGRVQPTGSFAVAPNGSHSFVVSLEAARNGNDLDGRLYTITVSVKDIAGNTGSTQVRVIVPHDQAR